MKILYIHQYFFTPEQPGGTRSYWIAQELIRQGHQVTMVTGNVASPEERGNKEIDGIQVIYLDEGYSQSLSIVKRLKSFLSFVFKSIKVAKEQKDIDIVIATSTPLTIGIPALYLRMFKKTPYIFEVRDLWPEVPIQMGALKNSLVIKLARWFEKKVYQNAEHVIALSPGMQDGVIRYIEKKKTTMIPNMSKKDKFWPREKNKTLMEKLKLKQDSFKIIHFGALGLANGADTIIESAKLMKDDQTVEFIFAGRGSQERELKQLCEKYTLNNVIFLGGFPMDELSEVVNFCDVSMVSFKDLPILYTNSPNKLFDSLSAGKPIIVNSAGWTKDMVEKHDCGYYVNPNKPEELVAKIKYLQTNPQVVESMGANARKLAEMEFDKSLLCKKFVSVVNQVGANVASN